jgi:SAM-dependent methyltransferase
MAENNWHLKLFRKSVLKQNKWKQIQSMLGETANRTCLDVGSDNGVISFLLRQQGGRWSSADLDDTAVASITELVKENVYQLDGSKTAFKDDEFDKIIIVDYLEHIQDDRGFIDEAYRILRPDGELIINVPHITDSLLRKFRLAIGQTDEKHGHLRPGYRIQDIEKLIDGKFEILSHRTYSRFFSEAIDTLITFGYGMVKKESGGAEENQGSKGVLVTSSDMGKHKKAFMLYSAIYPIVWLLGKLDRLLFLSKGYMMIVKAKSGKRVLEASPVSTA